MTDVRLWFEVELEHFTLAKPRARCSNHRVFVPANSGVYALLDENKRPLYIGMSCDMNRRVGQHWYPRSFVSFYVVDETQARYIERRLIGKHQPEFNSHMTYRSG